MSDDKHQWRLISRQEAAKRSCSERVSDFGEIYLPWDEKTIRRQARRCVQCACPHCMSGCPLRNRIPEWVALAAEGRFLEAAAVSQSTSNMPEICSRVCPQERLCESACVLNATSEPVTIGAIEKFINEYALSRGQAGGAPSPPNGRRVAIVGSGPGGLACADELALRGYHVVVFESQLQPGGLLLNGIPAFKLSKAVVARRVNILRQRGVVFRTGVTVGRDIPFQQLRGEFDAVFLGIGAQKPKPLGIPGAELKGVYDALPFLIEKNVALLPGATPIPVGDKRVTVLGGGDTAMDCLRTAIRCGAREALCLYRRDEANMPGSRKEYRNVLEEGGAFQFLVNPVKLEGNGQGGVARVHCTRMALGAPDASGRRKPRPIPGSEFVVPADVVLVAYGFDPVPFPSNGELPKIAVNDWSGIVVDENQMTSLAGVFAGGDSTRGPSLVVHAVRDGRKAALGIHRHLSGR